MKKPKSTPRSDGRRLRLAKEKVRELQPDDLADAAGGHCAKSYGVWLVEPKG